MGTPEEWGESQESAVAVIKERQAHDRFIRYYNGLIAIVYFVFLLIVFVLLEKDSRTELLAFVTPVVFYLLGKSSSEIAKP